MLNSKLVLTEVENIQPFCTGWKNIYSQLSTKGKGTQLGKLKGHKSGPNEKNSEPRISEKYVETLSLS